MYLSIFLAAGQEMSTLDALDCLGVCPANFEWFELNVPCLLELCLVQPAVWCFAGDYFR